jgi:hypothetical protein
VITEGSAVERVGWSFVLKARAPHTLLGIEKDMEVTGEA